MITENRTQLEPPKYLTGNAREWWVAMVTEYDGFDREPDGLSILTQAAVQIQRAEAARVVLDKDGLTYTDRFGQPRERPESVIERAASNLHRLLVRELGLEPASADNCRAPRGTRRF